MLNKILEAEVNKLFEKYVPLEGKSSCVAGEMIRALSRIGYRFWNDGDKIGVGYGNETCNAPARYLSEHGDLEISVTINRMWGEWSDKKYEELIEKLANHVLLQIEKYPLLAEEPTEDMWDHFDEDADKDDSWEDDDEDDWGYDMDDDDDWDEGEE